MKHKADGGRMMADARNIRFALGVILVSSFILVPSSVKAAAPTVDQVFQSMDDDIFSAVDPNKLLGVGLAVLALAGVVIAISYKRKRSLNPKPLHSPSKLVKEIAKEMSLRPVEVRQLRVLADRQKLTSPIVLLICPSLLTKAVREHPEGVDRGVLTTLARRIVIKEAA